MLGNNNLGTAAFLVFLNASIKNIQEGRVQLFRSIIMNLPSFVNKGIIED